MNGRPSDVSGRPLSVGRGVLSSSCRVSSVELRAADGAWEVLCHVSDRLPSPQPSLTARDGPAARSEPMHHMQTRTRPRQPPAAQIYIGNRRDDYRPRELAIIPVRRDSRQICRDRRVCAASAAPGAFRDRRGCQCHRDSPAQGTQPPRAVPSAPERSQPPWPVNPATDLRESPQTEAKGHGRQPRHPQPPPRVSVASSAGTARPAGPVMCPLPRSPHQPRRLYIGFMAGPI